MSWSVRGQWSHGRSNYKYFYKYLQYKIKDGNNKQIKKMWILYTNTQLYRVMKCPFRQQEAPVENRKYDNWRLKHGADYCTESNTSCEGCCIVKILHLKLHYTDQIIAKGEITCGCGSIKTHVCNKLHQKAQTLHWTEACSFMYRSVDS